MKKYLSGIVLCGFLMFTGFDVISAPKQSTSKLPPIKAEISIESEKISLGSPALVTILIQNLSDKKIDFYARASFELLKNSEEAAERNFSVRGDSYWSPFNFITGKALQLIINMEKQKKGIVDGTVVPSTMKIEEKGTNTIRVNVNDLLWNYSNSSIWPHKKLFDVVPKGRYWLQFELENDGHLNSNRIDITVE